MMVGIRFAFKGRGVPVELIAQDDVQDFHAGRLADRSGAVRLAE
jgi:hypothetical protein